MRKSRFTESQIIGVPKEVESGRMGQGACRDHGINEHTLYRWKKKYGRMDARTPSGGLEVQLTW